MWWVLWVIGGGGPDLAGGVRRGGASTVRCLWVSRPKAEAPLGAGGCLSVCSVCLSIYATLVRFALARTALFCAHRFGVHVTSLVCV